MKLRYNIVYIWQCILEFTSGALFLVKDPHLGNEFELPGGDGSSVQWSLMGDLWSLLVEVGAGLLLGRGLLFPLDLLGLVGCLGIAPWAAVDTLPDAVATVAVAVGLLWAG